MGDNPPLFDVNEETSHAPANLDSIDDRIISAWANKIEAELPYIKGDVRKKLEEQLRQSKLDCDVILGVLRK